MSYPEWQQVHKARQQLLRHFNHTVKHLNFVMSASMLRHSQSSSRSLQRGSNKVHCCHTSSCLQACYVVARVATSLFNKTAARRKDYIAQPKDNGYQSLHCTITLPPVTVECEGGGAPGDPDMGAEECVLQQGPTCELQIRTQSEHAESSCMTDTLTCSCTRICPTTT